MYLKNFFIGVWLLYNVVLVSTIDQCESAVRIGMCVFMLIHVQLCDPMDCSPPDSSVHEIS